MSRLTSPMGRKVIPLLAAFTLGALVSAVALEAKAWAYWRGEAEAQVAAHDVAAYEAAALGQAEAARAAIAKTHAKPVDVAGQMRNIGAAHRRTSEALTHGSPNPGGDVNDLDRDAVCLLGSGGRGGGLVVSRQSTD